MIRELTAKIGTLTQAHKQTLDDTLLRKLTAAREELARTLRQSYTRALQRTKSFFYTEGDKCGRLLARMINKKRSMTYIARMRNAAGQLHHMPDQIATAVTRFYTDLYAIPPHAPRADPNVGTTRMNAYLTKYTKLSSDAAEALVLEAPLTEGELALAIKSSTASLSNTIKPSWPHCPLNLSRPSTLLGDSISLWQQDNIGH
ncbi:Hypothetical predicted protein [Pelobates cultripes]|uniref:Uncharacterized protein n=1 Tax=Pelobates cultripes TaxID=61616 RepID=A0AAD1TKB2_PELCU|nr:Hypothetical predicted protein [Pelobates cultripes]